MTNNSHSIDVIVPVYNEEAIIETFYRRIKAIPLEMNLIFIDNASTDMTVRKLQSYSDINLIRHNSNEGYGGSVIDGLKQSSGDFVVIIDADCEYPPEAIPAMTEALKNHEVVYASRFAGKNKINMPKFRVFGNRFVSILFNRLFGQNITDLYTGFKALRKEAIRDLELKQKGFDHVLEMAVQFAGKGILIHEIPVDYSLRQTGRSKMKHLRETVLLLYHLFYYRFFGQIKQKGLA
ncbi:MAG TPA: glycosyltransferase family 2 protein [Thermodesulfovibrionia bacterium]|nr:glycosyltransferase family 2 protein [Thermodesulfovibrionia bacterium]